MHLAVIRIDDIVKVDGLPSHASGRATFTNGRTCAFDASFAHGHAGARIFVRPPADGKAMLGLMALSASLGTVVLIEASGPEAAAAVAALGQLIDEGFGEER